MTTNDQDERNEVYLQNPREQLAHNLTERLPLIIYVPKKDEKSPFEEDVQRVLINPSPDLPNKLFAQREIMPNGTKVTIGKGTPLEPILGIPFVTTAPIEATISGSKLEPITLVRIKVPHKEGEKLSFTDPDHLYAVRVAFDHLTLPQETNQNQ